MPNSKEEYWWKEPSVLVHPSLLPTTYTLECLINFATKMIILIILFGTVFYLAGGPIASSASVATLIYIVSIQIILNPPVDSKETCNVEMIDQRSGRPIETPVNEGFEDLYHSRSSPVSAQYAKYNKTPGFMNPYDGPIKVPEVLRFPTQDNPFMNMSVTDILDKPGAFTVKPYDNNVKYDDYFRVNWYSDPTDVFGKTQSQRQFYTMPSNSVPNDRDSYQKWLYSGTGSCKSGNKKACLAGTEGGHVPWMSMI
jgi:hypothetical protein